jgi:O-antigen ligase
MQIHLQNPISSRISTIHVWVCTALIGLLSADVVMGMFNAGLSPLKPILFTLFAVLVTITSSLLNKPRFAPAVFLVLLLPLVRVFDAIVLKRAEFTYAGQTEMDMMRMIIVLIAFLAVLATDKGLKIALGAAILSIFLTTGSEIFEMLGFAKFTAIPGRFAGFNGHPNFPPILLCEMLGIAFALCQNFRLNFLLIVTAYVGVGLTYGRSGFVVLTLMSGLYILMNARRNMNFLIVCVAVTIPLAGIGVAVLQSQTQKGIIKNKDTTDRMDAILNLDFDKLKSPERAKDVGDAMEAVFKRPFLGYGTGVSGARWAPHNEYVSLWLELGFPGLVLFVGTYVILIMRSIMTGGKAGYLIFAMLAFTPAGQGRIETPHFLLAMSTAGLILWPTRYKIVLNNSPSPAPAHTP